MISRPLKFFVTALLLCLILGCGTQAVKSLRDLSRLQTAIGEKFGDKQVQVNLNNGTELTVTFINSPLNAGTTDDRRRRAQETSTFIKEDYPSVKALQTIWVGFIKQETQFVFITTTYGLDFFGFDNEARPLRLDEHEDKSKESVTADKPKENATVDVATSGFQPSVEYDSVLDQTTVSVPTLVLTGNLAEGMAVAPHFTVVGDATGLRRAIPPTFVSFDFNVYSSSPLFTKETEIALLANGRLAFTHKDRFSMQKQSDGLFLQTLAIKVPFSNFKKFAKGTTGAIQVGKDQYGLTAGQLAGLREMTKYVQE